MKGVGLASDNCVSIPSMKCSGQGMWQAGGYFTCGNGWDLPSAAFQFHPDFSGSIHNGLMKSQDLVHWKAICLHSCFKGKGN